jgi:hypothetical protein
MPAGTRMTILREIINTTAMNLTNIYLSTRLLFNPQK